ncbi:MAG TPA: TonB family protein [Bryobacteraceae bacterium]|nr:TonB family protein [Bryobacteraceae bacterium]
MNEAPAVAEPVAVTPEAAPVEQPVERAVEPRAERPPEKREEQPEYPAASLAAESAPIQVTLPKSQPVITAASIEVPAPSRKGLVAGGVGGALVLVAGLFLLWPKGHPAKTAPVTVVAPKDIAPLQVLAEPLGNGLINVRWNAQSPLIAQARDGRLVITEHDKAPRTMALDAGQIKIGHLTYQSTAESIQFDLEVNDRSGGVAKESILAVVPPANAAPQAPHEQIAIIKTQVIPQPAPPKDQAPAAVEVPRASPVKARAFVPPPAQPKSVQGAIIDAPPTLANTAVAPVGVNLPASLAPLSPPPPGAPQQVRVESNLQAAKLIKKVVPVYPVLAKSAGIEGMVRFTALIDKDGKIRNLKTVSGPPPLVDAASEAVKRWVYRPTLLNGQAVEVITEIVVNFTISGASR